MHFDIVGSDVKAFADLYFVRVDDLDGKRMARSKESLDFLSLTRSALIII